MLVNTSDRADHIWFKRDRGGYKCCLCGGLADEMPPYPTPAAFMPLRFEPLTDIERLRSPGPYSRR
jgi:hypothetical protein